MRSIVHELELQVTGMTCGHCERAVTKELHRISGVQVTTADAASGLVRLTHDGKLDPADALAAVAVAGFTATQATAPSA
ncbi:hypothetical protein C5E07_16525 [Pseudoclavibacter sp. RFBJ3]|uniref:heavy-metal-associated domain-containing protein n=1 Tax=unclassified Pseudoclavibacter TaxID=2615177 RepID=UPI000CE7FBF8|nr:MULTISPECIES: heavy-metal-associated domain-containing protein [unclassified Pseudoclavibacter]PPF87543.1 hypothetical protein C5C12_00335 [Pseudoclavibacter sp. RFBJ5]PPF90393.1 hypothetical protein C5E07_16525 [Pseudoclavibacter sp. RFBJ3]PPG01078.1 hypothetical protein C5C19_00335 [Pseudoclavibacter sp. RFBH5]PPG26181.1 hypothetical protein C5E13_00290 [Pseudoclavibacter sp. RFBI4]